MAGFRYSLRVSLSCCHTDHLSIRHLVQGFVGDHCVNISVRVVCDMEETLVEQIKSSVVSARSAFTPALSRFAMGTQGYWVVATSIHEYV